ncbi:unnamed protein product [Mesocestoides corti]|uniref:Uncharacterized protein n=2 Tax=Mesocestoides corti TaxID=53468 RepID=A0A158QU79_MESCO|nr:unnamed protein product [Mesocestoides corti]
MCDYDRLKVVVAGDSGVGKTAFVHLLCYGEALLNPSWTVGCSVELTIFPRPRGDLGGAQVKAEERFFVEFWDIGGSARHANTRSVFYDGLHGIILVHDLTNKKSETNLKKWLAELTSRSSQLRVVCHSADSDRGVGSAARPFSSPPVLVVGTKLDQVRGPLSSHNRTPSSSRVPWRGLRTLTASGMQSESFAAEHGFPEILLNCNASSSLAEQSYNECAISSFLHQVVRFKKFHGCGDVRESDDPSFPVSLIPTASTSPLCSRFGGAVTYRMSNTFALNPFSVFSFGSHSVGIVSGIINVLIFISLARDKPCVASILCAIGCYISIYPGYLMLAVLSQCRTKKSLLQSIAMFVFFLTGLLLTTYFVEHNWDFLKHSYLSNIYALDTTPNLGIFWYMYVEMFSHFNVFFVWTMQLIIFCTCFALFLRFYDDPLFLALLLTMTTGVLKPYNSMSEFGCSLAIAMQWRHLFKYFRNVLVLGVMVTVALILAPLFFFTWLHTSTSNANFYFSASLMVGVVRVQLISQLASAYLRGQFHKKFGSNPRLSTGAKVVPCIRS